MQVILNFIITLSLALTFLVIVENCGFLYIKLLKWILKIQSEPKHFVNGITVNILVGLVVFAMGLFLLGVSHLLKPELILGFSGLPIFLNLFFQRWKQINLKDLLLSLKENKYILFGLAILAIPVLVYSFRPVTSFDGVWYHLAIPKMFLQQSNIDYNGVLFRYSVHPYINFFWNLWPLSLPFSTAFNSIVINLIQGLVLLITIFWATVVGKKLFGWGKFLQFAGPLILGTCSSFVISNLGWAYNDIYGLCFGLVTVLYIYYLSTLQEIGYYELSIILVLIIGLFLLKIFFGVMAVMAFIYLLLVAYNKLSFLKIESYNWENLKKIILKPDFAKFILFLATYFLIFILPWLIRSYYFTGRILDPIGTPGLNEDAYNFTGSLSADNHWRAFVWTRLASEIFPIMFNRFTPVFGLGMLAIFNSQFRQKYTNLWVFSLLAFWVVYFVNIVQAYRYLFPQIVIFVFIGITLIQILLDTAAIQKSLKFLILGISFSFIFVNLYLANEVGDLYIRELRRGTSLDSYMSLRGGQNWSNIPYYESDNSPKPTDLQPSEPIYISSFVNRTAYISNPYYTNLIQQKEFADISNLQSLVDKLKSKNIRFILNKNADAVDFCKGIGLSDYENCTSNNQYWSEDTRDMYQGVVWFRLK
ncbi:MAG: hypothetical protein WCK98_04705 [bacterium]